MPVIDLRSPLEPDHILLRVCYGRSVVNDDWVRAAAPTELEVLAGYLLDGKIGPTFTGVRVEAMGFAQATEFLRSVRGIDPKVIAWALRSIARERRRATDDPFP